MWTSGALTQNLLDGVFEHVNWELLYKLYWNMITAITTVSNYNYGKHMKFTLNHHFFNTTVLWIKKWWMSNKKSFYGMFLDAGFNSLSFFVHTFLTQIENIIVEWKMSEMHRLMK